MKFTDNVSHNVTKNTYLHRIIATAFIPNPRMRKIINHKNGIKTDNRIENLEWCTSGYNNQHALNTGLRKAAHSQINNKIASNIKKLRRDKLTYDEIGKVLGISSASVGNFLRGRNYKHLQF